MINIQLVSNPRTLKVSLEGKDADRMNAFAEHWLKHTDVACDPNDLAHYIVMRRLDKMVITEGDFNGNVNKRNVIKFSLTQTELDRLDDYCRAVSSKLGTDITRTQAIKSLLSKGFECYEFSNGDSLEI